MLAPGGRESGRVAPRSVVATAALVLLILYCIILCRGGMNKKKKSYFAKSPRLGRRDPRESLEAQGPGVSM